jgi:hypothetical protein
VEEAAFHVAVGVWVLPPAAHLHRQPSRRARAQRKVNFELTQRRPVCTTKIMGGTRASGKKLKLASALAFAWAHLRPRPASFCATASRTLAAHLA